MGRLICKEFSGLCQKVQNQHFLTVTHSRRLGLVWFGVSVTKIDEY